MPHRSYALLWWRCRSSCPLNVVASLWLHYPIHIHFWCISETGVMDQTGWHNDSKKHKKYRETVHSSTTTPSKSDAGGVSLSGNCDNTLSPLRPIGGRASQTVSPGSPVGEYRPRKNSPKSTHARRRPGGDAPSDKHELCDRKFTCPHRRHRGNTHASPSYPVRSPRTLRKPSSDTLKGPSESPPLRAYGASLSGGRPNLRIPP